MNFYSGEKSLWQMPEQMFWIVNGIECDIECFMLTNQNIRVEYLKKVTPFNKVLTELVIPLSSMIIDTESASCVSYSFNDNLCKISIFTNEVCCNFFALLDNKEHLLFELESFSSLVLKYIK